MELSSPLVPSAGPLSQDIAAIQQMAHAGAGAVVLWSLFEEQIEHEARELDYYLQYGAERFAESLTYFPEAEEYKLGPEAYLDHIRKAKKAVDIPVIASLNGVSTGGWISCARMMQQAGADGIELNVYYIPTDPKVTPEQVENVYLDVLKAVKSNVSIPVAMKLSPFFSATPNMMARLDAAGADALVLFNRFYQPDVDPEKLEVQARLHLSRSAENLLPLRWMAILRGKVKASLAATTGIHTVEDVVKMLMAGADVTMMCSALLGSGVGHLAEIRDGLVAFMHAKGYASVEQMKGILSQERCPEPAAFERANYMKVLNSFGPTATLE
jgi:dihydroorotate dehydrogenase (fumarate)